VTSGSVLDRLSAALVGRYRLERELGAGGMATVYLAHDERHDRPVAIKVLHEDLGATLGPERFLAEIKTTAKLQHPHILPLLDSGAAGGLLFYVMPFVEGESLRDRLEREKQLPIDDAVRIAREIADALGVAHAAGIVHRDIKPENILLQGGHALVADFGIALAVQQAGGSRLTQTGLSLGTPQYMAPEQAMGEKGVDARADLYALGAVTYEMLVGEPPFTGATVQAIVAKVISSEPEPPTTMRKTIPGRVEAAVLMALAKLPADRQANVSAFATDLRGATSGAGDARVVSGARRAASGERKRAWAVAGVTLGVFLGFALAWVALRDRGAAGSSGGVSRQYLLQPPGEAFSGGTDDFALSPDGEVLAYIGPGEAPGTRQLWIKRKAELHATRVAGTVGAAGPFFSPDGKWIAYATLPALMKVPVSGGGPLTVSTELPGALGRGAWVDDKRIVAGGRSFMALISPDGGRLDTVIATNNVRGYNPFNATAIPGTDVVLVETCPPGCSRSVLYAVDLKTKRTTLMAPDARMPVARGGGEVVFVTASGDLMLAALNMSTMAFAGDPRRIGEHVATFAMSRAGDIVYKEGTPGLTTRPVAADRSGKDTPIDPNWSGWITSMAMSPDQKRMAISLLVNGEQQVWLKQLPTGPLSKLTFGAGDHFRPTWSADGSIVYYVHGLDGKFRALYQRSDGTGEPKVLNVGDHSVADIAASRDGRWLVMRTTGSDTTTGLLVYDLTKDTTARVIPAGGGFKLGIAISPDSKYLAFISGISGRAEIYVSPFPDVASARWQVSRDGGVEPRWGLTGHELFFVTFRDELMSASYDANPAFHVTNISKVRDLAGYVRDGGFHTYEPMPGGKEFLMLRREDAAGPLVQVLGFAAEMKAKAKGNP
jgi:Tol biopolymer transport system component